MGGKEMNDASIVKSSESSSPSSPSESETEELRRLEHAPPFWRSRKRLSKQLSMCERPRDIAWERRRRQIMCQERRKQKMKNDSEDLTDEDLNELKGCIELGFGFNEEEGQKLTSTLPALDLYFAVNRQFATSPLSSPNGSSLGTRSSSFESHTTTDSSDSWKICTPGESPQQVKTRLRHWAQAVACSVMQSHSET